MEKPKHQQWEFTGLDQVHSLYQLKNKVWRILSASCSNRENLIHSRQNQLVETSLKSVETHMKEQRKNDPLRGCRRGLEKPKSALSLRHGYFTGLCGEGIFIPQSKSWSVWRKTQRLIGPQLWGQHTLIQAELVQPVHLWGWKWVLGEGRAPTTWPCLQAASFCLRSEK